MAASQNCSALCLVEGCENQARKKSFCSAHYGRLVRHGDPLAGGSMNGCRNGNCSVDGCDSPIRSKMLCNAHYQRAKSHGDTLVGGALKMRNDGECLVSDCKESSKKKGMCGMHYQRYCNYGDANIIKQTPNGEPMKFIHEAISRVTDECILWPYGLSGGYGCVKYGGRFQAASRVALILFTGLEPRDMHACHKPQKCHNPLCINARAGHLFWGSHAENMSHKILDGTSNSGEKCVNSKLIDSDVVEIRRRCAVGESRSIIAMEYDVSARTIGSVFNRETWSHIL